MVPQKNSDKQFDFLKDSIEPYIDGDWVTANGTTLGSDDGMGVATMLAILADKTLEHPALECLFTVTEEDGMVGANALKTDMLKGRILINLDSEEEGELYVGCAGGSNNNITMDLSMEDVPAGYSTFDLELKGLKGGHSGIQIILQRANANKVAVRFFREQADASGLRIVSYSGGNMRNAIPREAFAKIVVPDANVTAFLKAVEDYEKRINFENKFQEEGITFKAFKAENATKVICKADQKTILCGLTAMPHGVYRMSDSMPGLVETSTNLSIVEIADGKFSVKCMTRSLVDYGKAELNDIIQSIWELTGAKVTVDGEYGGWAPDMDSKILSVMRKSYETLFGVSPKVAAIHAGLETGIIGTTFPGMDMISVGPTLQYPHSPDERVNIASVKKFYDFIVYTLKNL